MNEQGFRERCYEVLMQVPEGRVTTYGAIAAALNSKAARAVGSAMAQNQRPIVVPCHRVVLGDGRVGEYALGVKKKIQLLKKEGVSIENGRVVDFSKRMFSPRPLT